jgi:hypothetical protein
MKHGLAPPLHALRSLRPQAPMLLLKHLWIFLALALLMLCALTARATEVMSPVTVLQRCEERFRGLYDYECVVELESRLANEVEVGACRFWFKQPRLLRANITRGKRKGSVVAVDRAGTIRGHKGGILKGIVRKMNDDDHRLMTIRGASVMGLDWGSFFKRFHAGERRPGAKTTLVPRAGAAAPYQVQLSYPDSGSRVREVYSFDPTQWVIVEGAVYENEVRVEHVVFRDIKVDTGVADTWFKL